MNRLEYLTYHNTYSLSNFKAEIYLSSSDGREDKSPGAWYEFGKAPSWFLRASDLLRSVQKNEITFDFDKPIVDGDRDGAIKENLESASYVARVLERMGIPFWPFFSGNKGFHLTLFIDQTARYSSTTIQKVVRVKFDICSFKIWLARWLVGGEEKFSELCIDPSIIRDRKHIIHACGSIHPKSGRTKTYLPEGIPKTISEILREVYFPPLPIKAWGVPEPILLEYLDKRISELREAELKRIERRRERTAPISAVELCAAHFLTVGHLKKRRRISTFLAAFFKRSQLSKDEAEERLIDWNESIQGGIIEREYLRAQISYVFREVDEKYENGPGCYWCRNEILKDLFLLPLCDSCPRGRHILLEAVA